MESTRIRTISLYSQKLMGYNSSSVDGAGNTDPRLTKNERGGSIVALSQIVNAREVWKAVSGFSGYEVSNIGRVRSLNRSVVRFFPCGRWVVQPVIGRKLAPATNPKTGYLHVSLSLGGKAFSRHIHRLVALSFVSGYEDGFDVCHIDGSRTNNTQENLRWDTRKGNLADTILHNTRLRGFSQNGAKLNDDAVISLRTDRSNGMTWDKIGEKYCVSRSAARAAGLGKTWGHVGQERGPQGART